MLLQISQFLTWPFAFVYFNVRYSLTVNGRDNLAKVSKPFIVIVNHFNFDDSFLFRIILGLWTPHLPLRFMAVKRFDWRWLNFLSDIGVIAFIYRLFGAFVVVPGRGLQKNLEEAKQIIAQRDNVVIYPEGKIVVEHTIGAFKPGAAVLADDTGTPVLPVALVPGPWRLLRRTLTVNIGEPIHVDPDATTEETTEAFHDRIVELYSRQ